MCTEADKLLKDYIRDGSPSQFTFRFPREGEEALFYGHIEVLVSTDPEDDDTGDGYANTP